LLFKTLLIDTKQIYAKQLFYPTLFWNIVLGRILKLRNWWDEIDKYLILGAIPFSCDVKYLKKLDVKGVLNLCRENDGPVDKYKEFGIKYYKIPVIDFTSPTLDDVIKSVDLINKYCVDKNKIYVHCKAGRGRSATVVLCWLIKHRYYKPEEAMEHILKVRPHINNRIYERRVVNEYLLLQNII